MLLSTCSLTPLNLGRLTKTQLERIRAIDDHDLWFVIERVKKEGTIPDEQIAQAVLEFKKYMALIALGHSDIGMLSPEVDVIWHNFILFTREYSEFCAKACGGMVHHRPNTSRRPRLAPQVIAGFINAYTTHFGVLPAIWRTNQRDLNVECDSDGESDGCDPDHDSDSECDSTALSILATRSRGDCDVVQAPCSATSVNGMESQCKQLLSSKSWECDADGMDSCKASISTNV